MAKQNILNDNTSWGVESTKIESNFAELYNDKIDKTSVVQTTGASLSDVMSQKAVTDEIAQLAGDVSVKIENLVVNGNFSSGTNGWTVLANTATISDKIIFNGVTLNNNGVHTDVPSSINNKIYLKFKATNEGVAFPAVFIYNYNSFNNSINLGWVVETASTIFNSLLGGVRIYFRQSTGTTYINATIDDVICIDLTDTFGAGNEPTKEEMDLLISTLGIDYFEGEIAIPAQKVMQWLLDRHQQNKDKIYEKANHGYSEEEEPKTLKEVDDDLAAQANIKLKNEVVNGDFSRGRAFRWQATGGDATGQGVIDDTFVWDNTSVTQSYHSQEIECAAGDLLYIFGDVKQSARDGIFDDLLSGLSVSDKNSFTNIYRQIITSASRNNFERISTIYEAKVDGIRLSLYKESANILHYKRIGVINLTQSFLGEVIDKKPIDELLNTIANQWFDNEVVLSQKQIFDLQQSLFGSNAEIETIKEKIGISLNLNTASQTIVGAINEVKDNSDKNEGHTHPMGGAVAWTFDGGTASMYDSAQIMHERGQYGTFFIQNGYVGKTGGNANGEDGITPEQILEIESMGHEIGGHSVTHPEFDTLTEEQMVAELEGNINMFKDIGVKNIGGFAYPVGKYSTDTNRVVRRYFPYARRTIGLGTGLMPNINSTNMGRFLVDGISFADQGDGGGTPEYLEEWKAMLRNAKNKGFVVPAYMHGFRTLTGDIETGRELFVEICDYCRFIGLPMVTMMSALRSYNLANTCDWKFENLNAWRFLDEVDKYTFTLDADTKFVGDTSLKIVPNGSGAVDAINIEPKRNRYISVSEGQRLSVSFRLNIPTDLVGEGVSLTIHGLGGTTLSKLFSTVVIPATNAATNGWITKSAELVIPSDTPRPIHTIIPNFKLNFTAGEVYIDMLEVIDLDQDVLL